MICELISRKSNRRKAIVIAQSLALVLFCSSLLFQDAALARSKTFSYRVMEPEYLCRTGWWRTRDGIYDYQPTYGVWRPTWQTRCFKTNRVRRNN